MTDYFSWHGVHDCCRAAAGLCFAECDLPQMSRSHDQLEQDRCGIVRSFVLLPFSISPFPKANRSLCMPNLYPVLCSSRQRKSAVECRHCPAPLLASLSTTSINWLSGLSPFALGRLCFFFFQWNLLLSSEHGFLSFPPSASGMGF